MIGGLGLPELMIIFFVILLLFGAKRLPELAAGLGKGLREFKKAANDVKDELEDAAKIEDDPKKK